jgi:alkaline phosphatase D
VKAPSGSLDTFGALAVKNVPIEKWDDSGLGIEPNNLKAINSLIAYRSLRYGRHLDLILTDQHSFCGDDPTDAEGVGKIYDPTFNGMFSEPAMIALDAGRTFNGGKPPAELSFGDISIPNPRKDSPPRTLLGTRQKKWFMDQLRRSAATWKIWGNSLGALDLRADPQNLPDGLTKQKWPADTFAQIGSGDYGSAYHERGEIYDLVRDSKITGSRSCRATVTAFGPAMPPPDCHPPSSSRSGSVSSAPRWPALGRWRLMSTVFPRIIRSVRCSWPTGQRVSPNGPTTCSSSTASARASNTPRVST